jgi:CheY-like chemotaxis protein/anti-sigma regulatory factor (Ser/Thr protein kinase)
VLQSSAAEPAIAHQAAERIKHNVRAQARLIDDLLDISRILSGKLTLSPTRTDAFEVIRKAADVVRSAAVSRSVAIELDVEEGAADGVLDPVRLEQVVWNLINNAVQASPDGGRVRVRARRAGSDLHVEVQDWGHGIDPVDLPHIFEPFRQGASTGTSHRGLGLGLAITKSIVDLAGGTMHAQSAGVGQGATFTLTIPLSGTLVPGDQAAEAELSAEERQRLQTLRVLYVEDDPDIAEAGRLTLSALGADVVLCLGFDEAIERLREGGLDVLVSDLNLGDGHSAIELLGLLRKMPHGRVTPAVVLSAYGSQEHVEASLRAGFASHLVKPVDATELARALLAAAAPLGPIPT